MESTKRHILFEHCGGYELFEMRAFENLAPTTYCNYSSLTQVVNHISSLPFTNGEDVAARIRAETVENSPIPQDLANFLALNNVNVLYADRSLRHKLADIGIEHRTSPEIMRGIRTNIREFLGTPLNSQLLLSAAHAISRDAIRYDMEREDNVAIAVGYECEELEAEIAQLSLRLVGAVEWTLPQLKKLAKDEDFNEKLAEIIRNEESRNGADAQDERICASLLDEVCVPTSISQSDLNNIKYLNESVMSKKKLLSDLSAYLAEKLKVLAPNLRVILGDRLCFKLIHKAGGLTNLALLPTSTLQLLGAEASLFRSLKMRGRTPKYGLIYNLDYIKGDRGRMCRFIANKCSLCARIDAFSKDRTDAYGKELKKLIEKKMAAGRKGLAVEQTSDLLTRVHRLIQEKGKAVSAKVVEASGLKASVKKDSLADADDSKSYKSADSKEMSFKSASSKGKADIKGNRPEMPKSSAVSHKNGGQIEASSTRQQSSSTQPRDAGRKKSIYDLTESAKRKINKKEDVAKRIKKH